MKLKQRIYEDYLKPIKCCLAKKEIVEKNNVIMMLAYPRHAEYF